MAAVAAEPAGRVPRQFVDWIDPRPVAEQISALSGLILDVAGKAADYITGGERIGAFARNFWEQRGIDAGRVRPIKPEFYEYWHGPDPFDPTRRVCDTHHWPVWIPEGLSLATVKSAGLRFDPNDTRALLQHINTPTRDGYYAVMRKEVVGRGLPEALQIQKLNMAGYPGLAQAAAVAAVIFAINQYDGSRALGKQHGCPNYTRCVERVAFDFGKFPLVVADSTCSVPSVHVVQDSSEDASICVVALRQF